MADRRRYGDESWRLARAGDAAALHRASALLAGGPEGPDYEARRARAFALAVEGDVDAAVAELDEGSTKEWPFPQALAADTARIRFLAKDYEQALVSLRRAVHGAERLDPQVAELVEAVAARAPQLRMQALRVALGGGTTWQRLRNAAAVAAARS